ncbi:winged helix-turn-helix transcriptional regulator [Truepera radiovictrix]|uniref:Transcriptional regulator, HxlR family n=1 Tax=Truepera radiovictrix (strain DSM 17093 / CIP 108686 / LMG 22925 / RQ-24) TaxID=649638 RepID=D7CQP8_TRURR|nr:helix-turn-helix domain-containing protein [Truepera radiovictrix]ADI15032.1 transcriptional regulator, HxlR family [Truepera radiovictrix DSM 17093]WMT56415.1 helix-turn-helix domain-containing protein [Truepera radiovictrix]
MPEKRSERERESARGVRAACGAGGHTPTCPVHASVNLLQEKWTLHIIRSLLAGDKGFNELGRDIGGCNPTTLAQRLERLEACGILSKTVTSTSPPRTRYALTEAGRDLQEVIRAISQWGERHLRR